MAPGAFASGLLGHVEPDARSVPWATIERLALEGGVFQPLYQPVSEEELFRLLDRVLGAALEGRAPGIDDQELALLRWWTERYRGGAPGWTGCACKVHQPAARLTGTARLGWQDLGDHVADQAGLPWAAGGNASLDLTGDLGVGAFWAGFGARTSGRVAGGGTTLAADDPLAWPGWAIPTGKYQVGRSRQRGGAWTVDVPRAVAGVRLGNWALAAGWAPRRVGAGRGGGITLDRGGRSFPALTARRTRPFPWQGFMRWLAPTDLLLRAGLLSARPVYFFYDWDNGTETRRPWFFEWLVGWEPLSWFRISATHTAMAVDRDGNLWPDLPQINFPVVGTTWRENDSGPITDRIFAVQFEFRWRDAPWPLLPADAGRLYWEYAGTDFHPSGPGGIVPEIAAPASVVGAAAYGSRWDLGLEYGELFHDKTLWYGNGGFSEGYSNQGWLLGHELGGGTQEVNARVNVRPAGTAVETGLVVARRSWGFRGQSPGYGDQWSVTASVGRLPRAGQRAPLLWQVNAEWRREWAIPPDGVESRRDWLRVWVEAGLP